MSKTNRADELGSVFVSAQNLTLSYQVPSNGFEWHHVRCAIGHGGFVPETDKREGDGCTPLGTFSIRSVFVRRDRITLPNLKLQTFEITQADGWCDDPSSLDYNCHIKLPYHIDSFENSKKKGNSPSHEKLWRDDNLYDLGLVIGHNDAPPRPGLGSCIFVHVMNGDYAPTKGCVSLHRDDLFALILALNEQVESCHTGCGTLHIIR